MILAQSTRLLLFLHTSKKILRKRNRKITVVSVKENNHTIRVKVIDIVEIAVRVASFLWVNPCGFAEALAQIRNHLPSERI